MTHSRSKKNRDFVFLAVFALVFFLTFAGLYVLGLVPSEFSSGGNDEASDLKLRILNNFDDQKTEIKKVPGEEPVYIEIPKVGVNITVLNPSSKNNNILNEYLLKGAVRYPGSGLIGEGNMLIFGHSAEAYKSVVNPAYRAFNGIEKLKEGDEIYIRSENADYVYKVISQKLVNASEEQIIFSTDKNMLTISTCNTFGEKQERYVVEAEYIGEKSI